LSSPGALPPGREFLRIFTAEGSAPGDFFNIRAIAGHPIAGVRTLPIFRSVHRQGGARPVRCLLVVNFLGFSRLKVPHRAIFVTLHRLRVTRLRVFGPSARHVDTLSDCRLVPPLPRRCCI
jgi:hypothetical protein